VRLTGVLPELRVSSETAEMVERMFVQPLSAVTFPEWNKATLQALRRSLVRAIEQHVERRMLTAPLLEAL
jgi:DNA repair protein RecO (recombination protein O)